MSNVPVIVMQLPTRTLVWAVLSDEPIWSHDGKPVLVMRGLVYRPGDRMLVRDARDIDDERLDFVIVGPAWVDEHLNPVELPDLVKRWKRRCRQQWAETGVVTGQVLQAPGYPDED